MRQGMMVKEFDPGRGVSIASLAYQYPFQAVLREHVHGSDQLVYAVSGVMEVHSDDMLWLIPPSFALWIPAHTTHRIRMASAVSMRTLYIRPGLARKQQAMCTVLSVGPLLRELILEVVRVGQLRSAVAEHRMLRDLTVLHISRSTSIPTETRMPRDPRALNLAVRIRERLHLAPALQNLCAEVGISIRTAQRLFKSEVGIDIDSWRRQVRLTKAVELLVAGESIKSVAALVGYSQPSAFVAAFKGTFGSTPKIWVGQRCKS